VTVVRSPLEATLSHFHFRFAKSHVEEARTRANELESYCNKELEAWSKHVAAVAAAKRRGVPVLVVHYENLKEDLRVMKKTYFLYT